MRNFHFVCDLLGFKRAWFFLMKDLSVFAHEVYLYYLRVWQLVLWLIPSLLLCWKMTIIGMQPFFFLSFWGLWHRNDLSLGRRLSRWWARVYIYLADARSLYLQRLLLFHFVAQDWSEEILFGVVLTQLQVFQLRPARPREFDVIGGDAIRVCVLRVLGNNSWLNAKLRVYLLICAGISNWWLVSEDSVIKPLGFLHDALISDVVVKHHARNSSLGALLGGNVLEWVNAGPLRALARNELLVVRSLRWVPRVLWIDRLRYNAQGVPVDFLRSWQGVFCGRSLRCILVMWTFWAQAVKTTFIVVTTSHLMLANARKVTQIRARHKL